MKLSKSGIFALIMTVCLFSAMPAMAGEHPAYLRALSDLRGARWCIDHRPASTWKQSADEAAAVRAIDAAIAEIKKASIDDGKPLAYHPPMDEINERVGRLRKALELLRHTRADVNKEEDNVFAKGLKARALQRIDEAIGLTERAIAAR